MRISPSLTPKGSEGAFFNKQRLSYPHWESRLVSNGGIHYASRISSAFSNGVLAALNFLKKLFSWLSCFKGSSNLEIYSKNLPLIREMPDLFKQKKKQMEIEGLKGWWRSVFRKMDSKIQRLLLIEDIVLHYAPNDVQNKREWAEDHFARIQAASREFVVNLDERIINGRIIRPTEVLPELIDRLTIYLEDTIQSN